MQTPTGKEAWSKDLRRQAPDSFWTWFLLYSTALSVSLRASIYLWAGPADVQIPRDQSARAFPRRCLSGPPEALTECSSWADATQGGRKASTVPVNLSLCLKQPAGAFSSI